MTCQLPAERADSSVSGSSGQPSGNLVDLSRSGLDRARMTVEPGRRRTGVGGGREYGGAHLRQAVLQLQGEEQVGELRPPVGGRGAVAALLPVRIRQVEGGLPVRVGGDRDDRPARWGSSRLVRAKWPGLLVPKWVSKPSTVRPNGTSATPALRCSASCTVRRTARAATASARPTTGRSPHRRGSWRTRGSGGTSTRTRPVGSTGRCWPCCRASRCSRPPDGR